MRRRLAAAALVEQHDAIFFRIDVGALPGFGATARTAVNEDDRLAILVAALFDIEIVQFGHTKAMGLVWRLRRIGFGHVGRSGSKWAASGMEPRVYAMASTSA